ncbi:MAG: hypothetical protein IPG26_03560 [Coprothermobacter sp.]|nr:hypothetical protein [Coprothermobacter sp.]
MLQNGWQTFNLKEIPYGLALAVSPFMEWYEVSKGKEPQMSIYALKTLRSKSDIDKMLKDP